MKTLIKKESSLIVKRAVDILVSLLFMPVICIVFIPFLGVLIKLESSGPVFFTQERVGKKGKIFTIIKFRTMIVNKEADSKQAEENDPRITRIGKFLRMSRLDEFPQLFNVLIGNMSLVGPRPHPVFLSNQYSKKINNYMNRLLVKPGITGLAQIKGCIGETKYIEQMENRIQFDLAYINNWNIFLDFHVLVATLLKMINGFSPKPNSLELESASPAPAF
jgi:putative colanic acid biosynthesis UDP-glucose lipid carrier transferase